MKKRVSVYLIVTVVVVLMLSSLVYAIDRSSSVGGGTLTDQTGGDAAGYRFNKTSPSSDNAQGGNVTHLNITTAKSTVKWAGYLGSVTATLRLGIGSDQLFSFGTDGGIKTVLASTDSSFDFSNLQTVTKADVDIAFGFGKSVDNATSTFNRTQTVAGVSAAISAGLVAHTAAINSSGSCMLNGTNAGIGVCALDYNIYNTSVLADNGTHCANCEKAIAFAVPVALNQRDFKNSTEIDYELMVAVSDGGTNTPETYFFFLDVE